MTYHNSKSTSSRGFTIIELLIVIVIIAILTAITVVAYNGIQGRAVAAKASATVDTYVKALEMYYIDNGHFPATGEDQICLGTADNYPATDQLEEGQCSGVSSIGDYVDEEFNQALSPYLSSTVDGSMPLVTIAFTYGNLTARGIQYSIYDANNQVYALWYYLAGDAVSSCYNKELSSSHIDEAGNTYTSCGYIVDHSTD
jgi:prepilin-type N-terminal cleavage/methylation domain-containing protein